MLSVYTACFFGHASYSLLLEQPAKNIHQRCLDAHNEWRRPSKALPMGPLYPPCIGSDVVQTHVGVQARNSVPGSGAQFDAYTCTSTLSRLNKAMTKKHAPISFHTVSQTTWSSYTWGTLRQAAYLFHTRGKGERRRGSMPSQKSASVVKVNHLMCVHTGVACVRNTWLH